MNLEGEERENALPVEMKAGDIRLFVEENDIGTSLKEGVSG